MLDDADWYEYEEYLDTLTEDELENELKWIVNLGRIKQKAKVYATSESNYIQ